MAYAYINNSLESMRFLLFIETGNFDRSRNFPFFEWNTFSLLPDGFLFDNGIKDIFTHKGDLEVIQDIEAFLSMYYDSGTFDVH